MKIRNTDHSWGLVSILFHWVMAVLFLSQFWLGWYMLGIKNAEREHALLQWHKSFGFLILGLIVLRLLWRLINPRPRLPDTMPEGEKALARGSHHLLYLLFLVIPLTGWAVISTAPLPSVSRFFGLFAIPALPMGSSMHSQQIWTSVHALFAYTMLFLSFVHILAALRHHFHHKDDVLRRMMGKK